jgi:hypothetical protein
MIFAEDFLSPRCAFLSVVSADPAEVVAALSARGLYVAVVRGGDVVSKETLLAEFAESLRFPDWGRNWDALLDLLRGLSWLDGPAGYVIAMADADAFLRNAPEAAAMALAICGDAAEFWREQGRAFRVVLLF